MSVTLDVWPLAPLSGPVSTVYAHRRILGVTLVSLISILIRFWTMEKKKSEEKRRKVVIDGLSIWSFLFVFYYKLCTETTNIIHSDSWQNVFNSRSWSPEKRLLAESIFMSRVEVNNVFKFFFQKWKTNGKQIRRI